MIIKRFSGKALHGYINVDVEFNDDLTFLYGINGSGKTTIVRSIHALLTLSLMVLAETEYIYIELEVELNDTRHLIGAKHSTEGVSITVSGTEETLEIPRYIIDADLPLFRQDDARVEWYSTQTNLNSNHVVAKIIESFPSPMYLGLERKAGSTNRRYPRLPNRDSRAAVFSSSLEASLNDASSFAAAAYRKAYIAESKLKDELRNDLILVSFAFEDISKSLNFSKKLPSKSDATKSVSKHRNIIDVLSKIGLEGGEFKKSIENFFSELTKIIQDLPDIPKSKK
jgi:predicted ATP-binding protein involved in virulence